MSQAKQLPGMPNFGELQARWSDFMTNSPPAMEVAVSTAFGGLQGGVLGYLMGTFTKSSIDSMPGGAAGAAGNPMVTQFQTVGGVWGQARGLAALCGVSAGLSVALKKARGKEDVWTQMGSAAGGGAAYTIASGNYNIPAVVNTALILGLVSGGFYKVSQSFKSDHTDQDFERGVYMLQALGLQKYSKNLKKGQLTDNTIMLWNDSALQEVRIPPGPRLLILHHLDQVKNPKKHSKSTKLPSKPLPPLGE